MPEFREYERGSTVLINAYLAPKMQSYVSRLDCELQRSGSTLQVMQSSGGIARASVAAREPVRTILSGPAGGVVGAVKIAEAAGFPRILTFDMGGTSTDVALIDTATGLRTTTEFQIDGMPVAIPTLNIHTVGAGGGSIAGFDAGGALKVGPESAGADPGPVCYGRGLTPTVTDANLLLGRLNPDGLLRGGLKLDEKRAREIFEGAKRNLPGVQVFAEGIVRLADAHMQKALAKISIEQGHDPRDFVLLSFGGAGPLHACALAQALRIPTVLVPNFPGALSAYGILVSNVIRDYSRTVMLRPGDGALEKHFEALESQGLEDMRAEGFAPRLVRLLDVRYMGQGYELTVPESAAFVEDFHREHERRYGYADRERAVEIVNARVRAVVESEEFPMPQFEMRNGDARQAVIGKTSTYHEGEWHDTTIYDRAELFAGDVFNGPAVVTEYSATTFVPPGAEVRVDKFLNLVIQIPH
ncbi:MAG: hydantoinase/oxoprolinase family protein [Acidobacteriaceae bacterium]|nr:hydantoinase/oxoprolinase family protein [Acidobacteriaceae bacterium]